jgi:hypothetical protein
MNRRGVRTASSLRLPPFVEPVLDIFDSPTQYVADPNGGREIVSVTPGVDRLPRETEEFTDLIYIEKPYLPIVVLGLKTST